MSQINYYQGFIGENPDFFSPLGWGREILSNTLKIPPDVFDVLFSPPSIELSVTVSEVHSETDIVDVGFQNSHYWADYLVEFPARLAEARQLYPDNEALDKYLNLNEASFLKQQELKVKLEALFDNSDKVARHCGTLILKPYSGRGIGPQLQEMTLDLFRKYEIDAVVTETTNRSSARIKENFGFLLFHRFDYADFGIPCDDPEYDYYGLWYRLM